MKQNIIILFAASLAIAACADPVTPGNIANRTADGLKGDVAEVLTESFRFNYEDDIEEVAVMSGEDGLVKYDGKGNKISESNDDGIVNIIEHDSKGFLKSIKTYYMDNDTTVLARVEFVNRRNGDMKEQRSFDETGALTGTAIFTYDGNKAKETDYKPTGEVFCVTDLIFENRKVVSYVNLPTEAEVTHKMNVTYGEDGKMLTKDFVSNYEGTGIVSQKITYGEDELPVRTEHNNPDLEEPVVETYTYEFDQAGNWIEKKIFVNGEEKPAGKVVRKITYR